jgi:hypothetical protein
MLDDTESIIIAAIEKRLANWPTIDDHAVLSQHVRDLELRVQVLEERLVKAVTAFYDVNA